jgi:hypothetical protein
VKSIRWKLDQPGSAGRPGLSRVAWSLSELVLLPVGVVAVGGESVSCRSIMDCHINLPHRGLSNRFCRFDLKRPQKFDPEKYIQTVELS